MAITYTKEHRKASVAGNLPLVTIDTGGMHFQGPTTEEEREELVHYLLAFLKRRREAEKNTNPPNPAKV